MSIDWAELYQEHFQALVRFLHRLVWDADQARDLAQETFARALDQNPDNPKAWLFRVASNLAKDEARTAIRRRKHLTLLRGQEQLRQELSVDMATRYERQERLQAVRDALAELSERDRDVLLLWDAGMNYQEIAIETGLSPGSVGTTLARARRRLVEAHGALEKKHVARG